MSGLNCGFCLFQNLSCGATELRSRVSPRIGFPKNDLSLDDAQMAAIPAG
jgi:hypothetical protein